MRGRDLVGADAVRETLAGLSIAIRPGEPEGAAPVCLVGILVSQALDDGEILPVAGERGEPFGQFPVRSGSGFVREPGLVRDTPAEAEEDESFRRRGGGGAGKAAEADRFEGRQGDERAGAAEEMAAGFHGIRREVGQGNGDRGMEGMKSISKTKQRHSLVPIPLSIPRSGLGDTNGKGGLGFEGEAHVVSELFAENGSGAAAGFRLVDEEMDHREIGLRGHQHFCCDRKPGNR